MKNYFLTGLILTSMQASCLQAAYSQHFETPCHDPGIAYEQSIQRAQITTVVVVGIIATAVVIVVLANTSCKHRHH